MCMCMCMVWTKRRRRRIRGKKQNQLSGNGSFDIEWICLLCLFLGYVIFRLHFFIIIFVIFVCFRLILANWCVQLKKKYSDKWLPEPSSPSLPPPPPPPLSWYYIRFQMVCLCSSQNVNKQIHFYVIIAYHKCKRTKYFVQ